MVRGSSSVGGRDALRSLIQSLRSGTTSGTPIDGPRGPSRKAKIGMIIAARKSGIPLLPVAAVPSRYIRLRSWDRTLVPMPFCKIVVVYGNPIEVPADADSKQSEALRLELEQALDRLDERAASMIRGNLRQGRIENILKG